MRLKDKVCIITGAARGIGKATAMKFSVNGAKVVICDLDDTSVQNTVKELSEYGEVTGFAVDVTKPDDIRRMVAEVLKTFGRIDVLINNAGVTADALLIKMTSEQFDKVIDVNLKGTFNCTKEVAPSMIQQREGENHQYFISGWYIRKFRTDKLCCLKIRGYRNDQNLGKGTGQKEYKCKCSCTRIHSDRNDNENAG